MGRSATDIPDRCGPVPRWSVSVGHAAAGVSSGEVFSARVPPRLDSGPRATREEIGAQERHPQAVREATPARVPPRCARRGCSRPAATGWRIRQATWRTRFRGRRAPSGRRPVQTGGRSGCGRGVVGVHCRLRGRRSLQTRIRRARAGATSSQPSKHRREPPLWNGGQPSQGEGATPRAAGAGERAVMEPGPGQSDEIRAAGAGAHRGPQDPGSGLPHGRSSRRPCGRPCQGDR